MTHEHDDQSRRTLGATAAKCPELVAKAADPDGWDYYVQHGVHLLWRYRPGMDIGEEGPRADGGWDKQKEDTAVPRRIWGADHRDFGPASRADCEAFLRGDAPAAKPTNPSIAEQIADLRATLDKAQATIEAWMRKNGIEP